MFSKILVNTNLRTRMDVSSTKTGGEVKGARIHLGKLIYSPPVFTQQQCSTSLAYQFKI